MTLLRHKEYFSVGTDLDPIEDILNLIMTLKSVGFTSDLLRGTHGFTDNVEIKKTAKLVSLHVDNAVNLAYQGFEGPPQTSFLPLYYSTLNLSKVYLLLSGKRNELQLNRRHGASYSDGEMSRHFLNEKIKIFNKGTIPLLYNVITGKSISKSGLIITLNEIYHNITSIGAEYSTITKNNSGLLPCRVEFIQNDNSGHFMKVHILSNYYITNPPQPRKLKAFPGLKIVTDKDGNSHYESKKYIGDFELVKETLSSKVNTCLNSDSLLHTGFRKSWVSYTPINGKYHVFNEDLSIMLAYFHLSNVVRYNPEHLYKLMDSKYWSIMLGLRKHGFLRFEKLMWGNFMKKSFDIN